jgi:hypothetical protein
MRTRCGMWITVTMLAIASNFAAAVDSGYLPPTAVYVREQFGTIDAAPFDPSPWEAQGGSWKAQRGYYDSTLAAPTAMSTITEYIIDPIAAPEPGVEANFTCWARMLNRGAAATQLIGIVYNYRDVANYSEAVFSPTGTLLVRRVTNGTTATVATTRYAGGAQNVWFDVEIVRDPGTTTIKVNGVTVVSRLAQTQFIGGRVGFITHNTPAKFDYISIGRPFLEQPFKENFTNGLSDRWTTSSPAWTVAGGTLNNGATEVTSRASPGVGLFLEAETTQQYSFWARMLNPYGGSGNLVGMYFHEDGVALPHSHGELLFSPTGVARIDLFYDGSRHTIATAPYDARRSTWFDVRLDAGIGSVSVAVDGVTIFDRVTTDPVLDGSAGLITHWAPGRFDDVWWDNDPPPSLAARFDEPLSTTWLTTGAWNTTGGTLNSTAVGPTDIVASSCACWATDYTYRARLLNQYGASGNLVGLIYNYQQADLAPDLPDYFEVVFSTTGLAFLNKVINGVRTRVASGTHNVPRNAWFDVEVTRVGTTTTVKVNGVTIFNRVPQGELGHGRAGVVTHWTKGRFDDLSVADNTRDGAG